MHFIYIKFGNLIILIKFCDFGYYSVKNKTLIEKEVFYTELPEDLVIGFSQNFWIFFGREAKFVL